MKYYYGPNHIGMPAICWNGDIVENGKYLIYGLWIDIDIKNHMSLLYVGNVIDICIKDNVKLIPVPEFLPDNLSNYIAIYCVPGNIDVEKFNEQIQTENRNPDNYWFAPAGLHRTIKVGGIMLPNTVPK